MDGFVAKHLLGVSRTYAILVPMLPHTLADAVGLAYLLMRIIDTVEDAPNISDDERLTRLTAIESQLAAASRQLRSPAIIGETAAERALMADAPEVFERLHALAPPYRDAILACGGKMTGGVREMMSRSHARNQPYPAIADATELRLYCYYVAGVVGEMLCAMMAHHLKMPALTRLNDVAIELGIGLQLVNILKDALKDSTQGRRYLPITAEGGLSHAEIYRAVLGEARASLRRGAEFVLALPSAARELRSFCGLPIAWGAMTLARAERDGAKAKIGRGAIRSSIELFKCMAGDDAALKDWFAAMLHSPQPRAI